MSDKCIHNNYIDSSSNDNDYLLNDSENSLIDINVNLSLRKHQKDAVRKINESLQTHNKCLVKMFCVI